MSSDQNITSVLKETRLFPAAGEFVAHAHVNGRRARSARGVGEDGSRRLLGRAGEVAALVQAVDAGARLEQRPARQVVRRRHDQRQLQLPRPASRVARKNKAAIIWEGEPGDTPHADLPATPPRSLQVRQRAEDARRRQGRPRHDLHADDPGSRRSPCWPVPASARRTRSSSAASRRTPSPTATTTPRRSSSSPPTAAGGAARSCR